MENSDKLQETQVVLSAETATEDVGALARGRKEIEIDCGVLALSGTKLNRMMKEARSAGVEHFILRNVCGQNLIGSGLPAPAEITVYGMMGNHSCAFADGLKIRTFPTRFPNDVWCPGDAQVAIGTSGNPAELNIAGSVDDLFASYAPSGKFRVAGQGGNRCVLRAGAGIPQAWREIDYDIYREMNDPERIQSMLLMYQKRRARMQTVGWDKFVTEFKREVERRTPPVMIFGRRVKDYFMEYAQGSVGIVLNLYGFVTPVGYYLCSGMTAGKALIRGEVDQSQLGMRVKKTEIDDDDRKLISDETKSFYDCFIDALDSDRYKEKLDSLMNLCEKDNEQYTSGFVKIGPV
jgi:glutamate synthase domain-containing protein 3